MEKKNYAQIMILFDSDPKAPLWGLCEQLAREENTKGSQLLKSWLESDEERNKVPIKIRDAIDDEKYAHGHAAFAIGYVIGQDYDIADEEVSAIVSDLRERIFKAKALPYFQRMKKEEPQPAAKQN